MSSYPPNRSIDLASLGPCLVIGACVILAIRTARRDARMDAHTADVDLKREIEYALDLANRVMMYATGRHASLFRHKTEPFTTGVVQEDVQL